MPVEPLSLSILSRDEVCKLLRQVAIHATTKTVPHLVSMSDPPDGPPREVENHAGRTLALIFYDTDEGDRDFKAPTRNDVAQIIEFAKDIQPGEHTVCHCNAGISRSSAAALTIIASKLERTPEGAQQALEELMRVKDVIHPNRTMVKYADELLGFEGSLWKAYAAIYGGGDLLWFLK